MYTLLLLDAGVLTTKLVVEAGERIDERRWRESLTPAISVLRSLGGGRFFVVHRSGDLAP